MWRTYNDLLKHLKCFPKIRKDTFAPVWFPNAATVATTTAAARTTFIK
jgi:hypothetical protein